MNVNLIKKSYKSEQNLPFFVQKGKFLRKITSNVLNSMKTAQFEVGKSSNFVAENQRAVSTFSLKICNCFEFLTEEQKEEFSTLEF